MSSKYIPKTPQISRKAALEELARRRGLLQPKLAFRVEDHLFDKQLAFVQDPADFKLGVTTRRAGKTVACASDLTGTALASDNVIVLYITLSRKNAKRLVWPELKKLNRDFHIGGDVNESDLSITYPNGSVLYVLGAKDRTAIEDFRGLPVKKVYLDEAQSFPEYIRELIDDVLGPALMDHAGQLILIGTPGPVPAGYFFELTKNKAWSHHTWSFFDNPKLPFLARGLTHKDMLERELKRRGVAIDDPSIQREWFGKWVVDDNSLVYHYSSAKNHYDSLPAGHSWTYVLGVDLGYEDADALALLAYSESCPESYLVEEVVTKHQDLSSLCDQIDKLKARYDITKIVVDTGGLGKKIAEEMGRRYSIPMIAAEKHRKAEYIELLNDVLRTGKLKIKADSLFAHDAQKVEWDHDRSTPDKKVISNRFHSDICEAVLYAWREGLGFTFQRPQEDLGYGTKAWGEQQAAVMLQAKIDELEQQREENEPYEEQVDIDHDSLQRLDRPKLRYQASFKKKGPPAS